MAGDDGRDLVCRGVGIGLCPAIGKYGRTAIGEIRRRKTRRKRQRRHRVALQRRELLVNALGRLIVGALPADRNQERQLPERLCEFLLGAQQQREMSCGGAAGVSHIDVRIGAIGDQRVGMLDHFRCHIGMQVEADHERQVVADHLADTRDNFAFAVVEMLGHHRPVQIEINAIDRAGVPDAVDDDLGDALIRILGDVCRRARGTPDGRHQLPALLLR